MKMSHILHIKKEISNTQPFKPVLSMSGTRPEIFEVSSTCSCSQCNSTDCFKIRYENANLQCTCLSCKYASHKNMQSKKPSDESYRELVTKVKDANNKSSLNTTTSSKLPNKKSYEELDGKASKDVVREVTEDSLNTNINKNMTNTKSNRESESLNLATKNSDEPLVIRQVLKEREQKDSLNPDIIQKITKETEQRDTPNSEIKSDLTNKKKSDGQFYSHDRETEREDEDKLKTNCNICGKKHKHKDLLNSVIKYSKSYYINKNSKTCCERNKRDDKSHEQNSTLNTRCKNNLPHRNHDNIRYRKITKKFVNIHVQTDTLDKHVKKENQEVDLCEHTNVKYKDTTFIKDKVKKTERLYSRNYSVAVTYTPKEERTEFENPTATLSAQIMDLPYQDFKNSLSLQKSTDVINSNKITKQDILAKLKQIYKACSCKVGECIPSFSGNDISKNDTCAPLDRQIAQRDCQQLPHSGCPCYRCDRKDCRGVWKNEMSAAMSCDCVQFAQSFTKRCDCEPCQCDECTSMNTHLQRPVIVAPVQGNFQQSRCQCEPCECANCAQNYGRMTPSLMREVSTGIVSQRNCNCNSCVSNYCQFGDADCRCDTQKRIVRKPIDRSGRDYDLRQAILGKKSFIRKPSGKFKNNDTITMFTFADNTYSNIGFSTSEDDRSGMDSEFNFLLEKEKRGIKIKNLNEYKDSPLSFSNLSDKSLSVDKYQHCERRWCCRNEEAGSVLMKTTSDCSCDTCNCMACKGLENVFDYHNKSRRNEILFYKTSKNGEGLSDNIETEFLYPLKKGKVLTPAMFEAKIRYLTETQKHSGISIVQELLPSNTILKLSGKNSSKKLLSSQNLTKFHSHSVKKDFNGDHYQLSYKNMNSKYPNDSNIHTGSFVKDEGELLFNSQVSNVRCQLKVSNSDADLFFSRIKSIEKSLSQVQDKISLNRKNLAEIWSKDEKCGESSTKLNFDDNIVIMKNSYENRIPDDEKRLDINEETITLQNFQHETRAANNKEENALDSTNNNFIDRIQFDQNDSFSKGDNKMYTQPLKRYQKSVTKSKKHITRTKFKKLSKNSNNDITDFITKYLKENYKHHGYNLNRKCTKSTSTSYENCSVLNQLKFEEDVIIPLKEVYESNAKLWSVLRKNVYANDSTVTCNDDEKTDCNIPELEINTKRAVQSISLQTNETQGHAALAKLQTEVSKLLNSPLLQLGYIKTYLTSDMDRENIGNTNYCRPKTKIELDLELKNMCCDASLQTSKLTLMVEKEINCDIGQSMEDMKIDMAKLLDFLLTRTVCKSELTRPIAPLTEMFIIPKVNDVKSSCEGLKARFLAVRKVSDHTVLVRWKMPREVENVQGYELQVDGRTVQKILSPTRCVAVLTCLPHCDKILLTVRTLTHSVPPSERRPAATIVYYPREKHSRRTQRNTYLHAGT